MKVLQNFQLFIFRQRESQTQAAWLVLHGEHRVDRCLKNYCLAHAETPVWRKAGGQYPLCNACGVSKRAHGVDRKPPSVLDAPLDDQQALPDLEYGPIMDLPADDTTTLFMPYERPLLHQVSITLLKQACQVVGFCVRALKFSKVALRIAFYRSHCWQKHWILHLQSFCNSSPLPCLCLWSEPERDECYTGTAHAERVPARPLSTEGSLSHDALCASHNREGGESGHEEEFVWHGHEEMAF